MNINFKIVDASMIEDVLKIEVLKSQAFFVDSISECLKKAEKDKRLIPTAIYNGETLIGFSMYGFKKKIFSGNQMWIDHFIIDKHFQGNGYGKIAFEKLLELVKSKAKTKVYLSVNPKNLSAIHIYQKYGFKFNGKYNRYLEKIMVLNY